MKLKGVFGNWKVLLVVLLSMMLVFSLACAAGPGEGKVEPRTTIRIAECPWSSTPPILNILEIILTEDMGYEVERVAGSTDLIFAGLGSGDVDVHFEGWLPNVEWKLIAFADSVAVVGLNYAGADQGWWVPNYVDPNLTSIAQLNDYVSLFDSDGDGKGEFQSLEPGSSSNLLNQAIIDALGLNYVQTETSEWALLAAVKAAYAKKEPILFYTWTPHWIFFDHELRFLEDPTESYGPSVILMVVHRNLLKSNPDVVEVMANFSITMKDMNDMIYRIEIEKDDARAVAREWIEKNRSKVDSWLEGVLSK